MKRTVKRGSLAPARTEDISVQCQTCGYYHLKLSIKLARCTIVGYRKGRNLTSCAMCATGEPLLTEEEHLEEWKSIRGLKGGPK
jgi:hypothetical protein